MNFSHALQMMGDYRVAISARRTRVSSAALSLLATEPGAASALQAYQAMETPRLGSENFLVSQQSAADPWWESIVQGMRLSRRQALLSTFCARVEFQAAVHHQYKTRPPITKPYNLFTVWYLFVAGLPVDKISRDAASYVAKYEIENLISCSANQAEAARNAANAIFGSIAHLEESGFAEPENEAAEG